MSVPNRSQRAVLRRMRRSISEREMAVVADMERFRYLTSKQIEGLHFADLASEETASRTCRRVLRRLARQDALRRLERRIGGLRAGSSSYVYALGPLGHRLLHEGERGHYRFLEPSGDFLDHYLQIAELVVDLRTAEREGIIELAHVETEPQCWRTFSKGLSGPGALKPDLALTTASGEYEYRWFVEIDLASHSPAAVVRKCHIYNDYWTTGAEQQRHEVFPKVLILVPSEARAARVQRAMAAVHRLKADLFEVDLLERGAAHITEAGS